MLWENYTFNNPVAMKFDEWNNRSNIEMSIDFDDND